MSTKNNHELIAELLKELERIDSVPDRPETMRERTPYEESQIRQAADRKDANEKILRSMAKLPKPKPQPKPVTVLPDVIDIKWKKLKD